MAKKRSRSPLPDTGTVEERTEAELPIHARNLIAARNHLMVTSQNARNWAIDNGNHPVSYLLLRDDVGEQTKVQALRRIETVSLPTPVMDLLEAARYFNECQAESQLAFDSEPPVSELTLPVDSEGDIVGGLRAAYLNLLRGYRNWGGFRFHGWTSQKDKSNYYGPAIWSEGDCVFRFARSLEREFPDRVHLETRISKAMTASYDPNSDKKRSVDIVVGPAGMFGADLNQHKFRNIRHDLFIEAKWLKKGRWTKAGEHVKRCSGIQKDLKNLKRSLDRDRCAHAAMLIVDDEGFLDFHGDILDWPEGVIPLIVSPGAILDENLGMGEIEPVLDEIEELHAANCACNSGPLL